MQNAGVMPHVPKPQRGSTVSQGLFPKERFRYDGGEDIYICPDGQRLYTASASAAISSSPVTPIAPRARSANSSRMYEKRLPSLNR